MTSGAMAAAVTGGGRVPWPGGRPDGRPAGFTLLELVVVLGLTALLTALALPRFAALQDSVVAAFGKDDVARQVGGLPYAALRSGRPFVLLTFPEGRSASDAPPLDLPDGWSLEAEEAIHFRANGSCSGGEVKVRYGLSRHRLRLVPPECRVEWLGRATPAAAGRLG